MVAVVAESSSSMLARTRCSIELIGLEPRGDLARARELSITVIVATINESIRARCVALEVIPTLHTASMPVMQLSLFELLVDSRASRLAGIAEWSLFGDGSAREDSALHCTERIPLTCIARNSCEKGYNQEPGKRWSSLSLAAMMFACD